MLFDKLSNSDFILPRASGPVHAPNLFVVALLAAKAGISQPRDSDELRESLRSRGAWANIKPMPNRKNVPALSRFLYRYRNLVERFFNKIKHYRREPTTSSPASNSLSIRIWISV